MSMTLNAYAAEPYKSYIYDFWGDPIPSQNAYRIDKTVTGFDMGLDRLSDPADPLFIGEKASARLANSKDMFFDPELKQFWVADTDNNRILRLDEKLKLVGAYTGASDGKNFKAPSGVYVKRSVLDGKLYIYIADYENSRIVKASVESNTELELVKEYTRPETDLYTVETFNPSKVVADKAENVYAVCTSVNQGAVQFTKSGKFQGYFGANRVEVTAAVIAQKLWRKFASNEQISGMTRNVPVEYANFDIDDGGFIYTVTEAANATTDAVKKLNPAGYNIWNNAKGNSVSISGGVVSAEGGSDAADIGSSSTGGCASILVSGGTVKRADGGTLSVGSGLDSHAGFVTFAGGAIYATLENISPAALDGIAKAVYPVDVPLGLQNAKIEGLIVMCNGSPIAFGNNDLYTDGNGVLRIWLSDGDYEFATDGDNWVANVSGAPASAYLKSLGVTVNGTDIGRLSGEGWTFDRKARIASLESPGPFTVSGSGSELGFLAKADCDVAMTGLSIANSTRAVAPFDCGTNSVTMTLYEKSNLLLQSRAARVR